MTFTKLKEDIYFLCGATSATYLNADITRNINIHYDNIARTIWESDGTWNFDDGNNTDLPVAFRTVSNASATYLIPTTAIRIEQVEIKDGNGNWNKLKPINYHDLSISPDEFLNGSGLPLYYMLEGTQISLYPAPGTGYVTMSSGMQVRLSRAVTEMAVTATTTTPGFAVPFHRILSYAAALDYEQNPTKRQWLALQKQRLEDGLKRFYSKRGAELKTRLRPATKRRWRSFT